jgi:hypothetical protein
MGKDLKLSINAFIENTPDILDLNNICGACDYYSDKLTNDLSSLGAERIYVIGHTCIFENRCRDLEEYPNPDRDAYHSTVRVGDVVLDPTWRQFDTSCTDIISIFDFREYTSKWIHLGSTYREVLASHNECIALRRAMKK